MKAGRHRPVLGRTADDIEAGVEKESLQVKVQLQDRVEG